MKPSTEVHLICYSDSHGRFLTGNSFTKRSGDAGLDRLATYVKSVKDSGNHLIVIDNGDSIQGTPLVDLHDYRSPSMGDRDHPLNVMHEHLSVNCFIPGNHEFNFGLNHLLKIKNSSKAHWLSANVLIDSTGEPLFTPFHQIHDNGISITIIGLVTAFVERWESASLIEGLRFESALDTCARLIPKLREKTDFLIISYHGGFSHDPKSGTRWSIEQSLENEALEIWNSFPEIDLLITGHQHRSFLYKPEKPDQAVIVQPSSYSKAWCHLVLSKENSDTSSGSGRQVIVEPGIIDPSAFKPDDEVRKSFQPHISYVGNILSTPLGTLDLSFRIENPMSDVWLKKHPLIQWVNNLLCHQAGVDISASPLLDATQKGLCGNITIGDILEHFFFQDSICVIKITGEILRLALEKAAGFFLLEKLSNGEQSVTINPEWKRGRVLSYNYDIWEGIEYTLDIRQPEGSRVTTLSYRKKPVADKDEIFAAITSYRAGGAFYQMFSPDMVVQEFPARITDLMTNDLLQKKNLSIHPIQNFTIVY